MILTLDPAAYQAGFKAGEERKARCPYQAGTREAWSWRSGFIEGSAGKHCFV